MAEGIQEEEKMPKAKQVNGQKSKLAEEKQTNNEDKSGVAYKLVPPEGGWGYVIVAAMTFVIVSTITPICTFGIFYSDFLKSVGDETSGTTLANAIFNTVSSFTGLATNFLLKKFSYRKVGLLGAFLFSGGAFGIILSQSMIQFIVFFSCFEGIGFGLLYPASCTAANCYFKKRLNLMMSISTSVMAASNMAFPPIATLMMSHLGFKLSITVLALISLLNLPAMLLMQPVKRHMKKVPALANYTVAKINVRKQDEDNNDFQEEPLMSKNSIGKFELTDKMISYKSLENGRVYQYERTASVASLDERAKSVTKKDKDKSIWQSLSNSMDLSLLKDWRYLNISIGLSLGYIGDITFVPLIPLLLTKYGFSKDDVAYSMMIFFGLDLSGRMFRTMTSSLCKGITNRQLFLGGTFLSACFRVAFLANDTYVWKVATLGCLGLLRSHIQTPFTLVISENYHKKFSSAFSLLMVMVGCVSLIVGPLLSIIKHLTGSDVMVCHLLTLAFVTCSVAWLLELLFWPKKKRGDKTSPF